MATRRWIGNAVAVKQITTITISDTWAAGDTATLTINGKDLVVTVGDDDATDDVALLLSQALGGQTLTDPTAASVPPIEAGGGQAIPEFTEFTASAAGPVVTLTGATAGKPFAITGSVDTAGDGDLAIAQVTAATGPNFFDDPDNWSGGVVPADGDHLVLDAGHVDLKYALDQHELTPASLTITMGYTGKIGLPETNRDDASAPYREYRPRYLTLCDAADATNTAVTIGQGEGAGSGRLLLDLHDGQVTVNVLNTGQRVEAAIPALVLGAAAHASNVLNVLKGDVGVALVAGESATLATLRIGYRQNRFGDSVVRCGAGVTLGTIEKDGGQLEINSAIGTSLTQTDGETIINGTGAVTGLVIRGGQVRYNTTGTLGGNPVVAGSGELDFSRDMRAKTITNPVELYGDRAKITDPFKVVSGGSGLIVDMNQTGRLENLSLGENVRITRGTPA